MKQFLKRRKLIFLFRLFALVDVLFYDKFELKVYTKYGYYLEDLVSMTFEGKEGMEKIQKIMAFFRNNPPKDFAGCDVERVDDIKNLSRKYIKTSKGLLFPAGIRRKFHPLSHSPEK